MPEITIRTAQPSDAEELLKIYAPYVTETAVTFEYDVPTVSEFAERISSTLENYPYLAALQNGEIVGYAYAGRFKSRAAYDYAVEVTVYVRRDKRRSGVGKLLYSRLEEILKAQNITNLYACIAYTENTDDFLTNDSADFHSHMGYRMIGVFKKCGYKFNRWYDMVWMEKMINEHVRKPAEIIPFKAL